MTAAPSTREAGGLFGPPAPLARSVYPQWCDEWLVPPEECPEEAELTWLLEAVGCAALWPYPLCEELAANDGAARNSTEPVLATRVFRCRRLPYEPRGMPKLADPLLTTRCIEGTVVTGGPPFPTATVLTVPTGATGGWNPAAAAPT